MNQHSHQRQQRGFRFAQGLRRGLRLALGLGLIASLGVLAPDAHAEDPAATTTTSTDAKALIDAIESKYSGVKSIQAQFVQTQKSELYGETTQKGKVSLKRPTKMRWLFEEDGKQFITDGATMWIHTPAEKQVIRYSDMTSSASAADSLLQSLDQISDRFNVNVESHEEGKGSHLSLTPKSKEGAQFKTLTLKLDGGLVLSELAFTDPFDTVTSLSFASVKLNSDVPDSLFEFTVPKGTSVIDAGG